MLSFLQKPTLVSQAAGILRQEIVGGTWPEWIPSEREISSELRISRPTLRLALDQLRREGLLEAIHGVGHRVCGLPGPASPSTERFAIDMLCPEPLGQLPHQSVLWIDELRHLLNKKRCELRFHHGSRFLRKNVAGALERIVAQNRGDCWLLCHSNERIQRWFADRKASNRRLSAVIMGYPSEGCRLPAVVIDYEAACVHGIGKLLNAGHRRIIFFRMQTDRLGDVRSELAAMQAARKARESNVQLKVVIYKRSTVEEIVSALRHALLTGNRFTAMLIDFPSTYLTVATVLPTLGIMIPRDVSLICRQYDRLFEQLLPRPVCYAFSAADYAARIYRVLSALRSSPTYSKIDYVIPRYSAGASVGPPRL